MPFRLVIFKKRFPAIYQTFKHNDLYINELKGIQNFFQSRPNFPLLITNSNSQILNDFYNRFKVKGNGTKKH